MPKKIGKDTLNKISMSTLLNESPDLLAKTNDYREKVLTVLKEANDRLSISQISRKAEIAWTTTRNALKELLLLDLVEGERVGTRIYFNLKQPQTTITTPKSSVKVEEGVIWFIQGVKKLGLRQKNVKILVDKYGVEKASELIKRELEKKGFTPAIPNDEIEKKLAMFIFEFVEK